jgi:hypothetical protein
MGTFIQLSPLLPSHTMIQFPLGECGGSRDKGTSPSLSVREELAGSVIKGTSACPVLSPLLGPVPLLPSPRAQRADTVRQGKGLQS